MRLRPATFLMFFALLASPARYSASESLARNPGKTGPPAPSKPMAEQPHLASDCTLFASASGNDKNTGNSPSSPKTFLGAAKATVPGSVLCVLGGTYFWRSTFYPPHNGTADAWIVYKAYGDSPVNIIWTGSNASGSFVFAPNNHAGSLTRGAYAYLEFSGFHMDGGNNAGAGIMCRNSHHLRFTHNFIKNFGASGIAAVGCDYLYSDHNLIYHNGYHQGWSSGISYNGTAWYDAYSGIHNVVSNNIISGQYDNSNHHSDGNGIIMDLSADRVEGAINRANTPPALIVNNIVYQNGGRCILNFTVTNIWVVNNTCYKNNLDPAVGKGKAGGIGSNASHDDWFVNNISVSWSSDNPAYYSDNGSYNLRWYRNMHYGAGPNFTSSDAAQFFNADPLFVNSPAVHPSLPQQYAAALPPHHLGDALRLRAKSPALGKGVDPSTLPNVPPSIGADLKKYIYLDIDGNQRPPGKSWDLGAHNATTRRH